MAIGAALLVLSSFLASAVEGVEALTIVLATGITRGWRSALIGVAAALVVLAVAVAIFGTAIANLPIAVLRVVVGTILLIFGLQWLRKAIARASGWKAHHDEAGIFEREVAALEAHERGSQAIDWPGFVVSFKGVLLEGLEVAFIVVTFGASATKSTTNPLPNGVWYAAVGALAAIVLVTVAGIAVHRPLSQIPENTLKFAVGIMLTTYGTFWAIEGVGGEHAWPWGDLTLLALIAGYGLASWGLVTMLRRRKEAGVLAPAMRVGGTV